MSDRQEEVLNSIDRALIAMEYDLAPTTLDEYLAEGLYVWQLRVMADCGPSSVDAAARLITAARRAQNNAEGRYQPQH
jgi:hypothetical protein